MKKIFSLIIVCMFTICAFGQNAKYVFYFIGDGMGINTVAFTEYYKAAKEGKYGASTLNFGKFPVSGTATTWCSNNLTTDSAASGTALATGHKTTKGTLGLDADGNRVSSIAAKSLAAGRKVAVLSNVGVNHATPAAFYAHQPKRGNYDQIIMDLTACGFDFISGSEFIRSKDNKIDNLDPKAECEKAGFTVVQNKEEYKNAFKSADKMVYIASESHFSLRDRLSAATEFLMKDGCKQGFFIMTEGGRIDGCCHGNDAQSAVEQVLLFEETIAFALDFYNAHPNETAILVTADHDTGGPALSLESKTNPLFLDFQKHSIGSITKALKKQMKKQQLSWEDVKAFLDDNLALWSEVKISQEEENDLKKIYDKTIAKSNAGKVTDEYGYNDNAVIVAEAAKILDAHAGIKWTTKGHTASFVPVCYLGPQQELFSGRMDNTMFAEKLEKISLK